jgi:hypothetical protein
LIALAINENGNPAAICLRNALECSGGQPVWSIIPPLPCRARRTSNFRYSEQKVKLDFGYS